ncbi:hypothetical protein [Neolewinella persica]|nr:hypothetical protein [Neolewinella persica]
MESFNNFSLINPETIFGGTLVPTHYIAEDGTVYYEWYDTTRKRLITLSN